MTWDAVGGGKVRAGIFHSRSGADGWDRSDRDASGCQGVTQGLCASREVAN